ncbi:hypothetical protein LKMONMHP_3458 [Methylobacterium organophilum]|uniref:Uncharacterized protein n=1 Tax=Methylobacterium organophilum TaxID=410 RepID=A0ABQ4TC09_METOR|nr:hypothetical protein LKMONMHP_3458 [Methylobacterium organophilum]
MDFGRQNVFDVTIGFTYVSTAMPSPLEMSRRVGALIVVHAAPEPSLLQGDVCFSNIF